MRKNKTPASKLTLNRGTAIKCTLVLALLLLAAPLLAARNRATHKAPGKAMSCSDATYCYLGWGACVAARHPGQIVITGDDPVCDAKLDLCLEFHCVQVY